VFLSGGWKAGEGVLGGNDRVDVWQLQVVVAGVRLMLQTSGSPLPTFSLARGVCDSVSLPSPSQGSALLALRIKMAEGTAALSVASQQ
jgi:hypothetical protein